MSLSTHYLEYGRHVARLQRRRRRRCTYAPTSYTASQDNHEKINSWVSFSFLYGYWAPLGGPSPPELCYEELTLAEFVAGYGQILLSPDLSEVERSSRLKHLVSLMYFSQLYDWQAVLSFHGAVLLEIERGLLKWEDLSLH